MHQGTPKRANTGEQGERTTNHTQESSGQRREFAGQQEGEKRKASAFKANRELSARFDCVNTFTDPALPFTKEMGSCFSVEIEQCLRAFQKFGLNVYAS
jgi:hypothetical protein